MNIFRLLGLLCKLDIARTLFFNFKYFPFATACRFPAYIYHRTKLHKAKGEIVISVPVHSGMIKIGEPKMGARDMANSKTIWEVKGNLIIGGTVTLGRGTHICIDKNGTLALGNNFCVTGNSSIICQKEISIDKDCLISWDVLIMDTDFHPIKNTQGNIINAPRPIHIGKHVWIGCRNTILKGVSIADNVIVSANSTITKSITENYCAVGGIGNNVEIIKKDIYWEL